MLDVEQPILAYEIRQLPARPDTELEKNVGEMRADRARRDLERASDFLVGLPRSDHPRDFHLAAGQSTGAGCHRLGRWSYSELTHLLPRSIEIDGRAKAREHVMRLAELAHACFAVAHFDERSGEPSSDARGLRRKGQRLELFDGRLQQLDRAGRVPVAKSCEQAIAGVRVREAQPVLKAPRITPHPRQVLGRPIEVASRQRCFTHHREQPLQRPHDVSSTISYRESRFADANRFLWMSLREVVGGEAKMRRDD